MGLIYHINRMYLVEDRLENKILLHYMQIFTILKYSNLFDITFPKIINNYVSMIGDPIITFQKQLDCMLSTDEQRPLMIKRLIYSLLAPVFYFFQILILFSVLKSKNYFSRGSDASFLLSATIIMVYFLQSGYVNYLVSLLSCRKIGSKYYVLADITQECHTDSHNYYSFNFVFPAIGFWSILIPLSFIYLLI